MINKPLVSIVVPIYNAEKYLDRCVNSLINQTYEEIEIILVDDGAKDLSGQMCDKYKEENDNIYVIHQANAGDSAARNAGIKIAKGEFLFFVDADDYVPYDSIEELIKEQQIQDMDIVIGMVNAQSSEKRECVTMSSCDMAFFCINQKQYIVEHKMPLFVNKINPGSQCMKIIRKSTLINHNVWFNEKVKTHHQDTLFSMSLYAVTNKIALINFPSYYYDVDVPGSMRKQLNTRKLQEAYVLVLCMRNIIGRYTMCDNYKQKLIKEFYISILYECWSEYFTHGDNRRCLKKKVQDLVMLRNDFEELIPFQKILKEDICSYPKYQQLILKLMLTQKFKLLAIIAMIWSLYKRKRND